MNDPGLEDGILDDLLDDLLQESDLAGEAATDVTDGGEGGAAGGKNEGSSTGPPADADAATDITDGGDEGGAGGKNEGSSTRPPADAEAGAEEATTWQCGLPSCTATGTMRCTSCKAAYYCSQQHQRIHWKVHKVKCRGGTASKNGQAQCMGGGRGAAQRPRVRVPAGVSSEYFAMSPGPSTASSGARAGGSGVHSDKYDELVLKSAEPGFAINSTRMSDGHLPILFGEIVCLSVPAPFPLPIGYRVI